MSPWPDHAYTCWTELEGTTPVLCVRGDLDVGAWRQFPQQVSRLADETRYPVIDLSETSYIDMLAIRELERLAAAARARRGDLVIVRPSPIVRRVFEILELHTQMAIVPSRGDAVTFIARHAARDPDHVP